MEIDSRDGDYENRINHNVCLPVEKKIGVIFSPQVLQERGKKTSNFNFPSPLSTALLANL